MADSSISSLCWPTLWASIISHIVQSFFPVAGSISQAFLPSFDVPLYFDDATITDLRSSKGSGQWAMNQLCSLIGSPFAKDKKQSMQSTGTFLGLTHDLECINQTGHVRFWACERLHDKVRDLLTTARTTGHFSRGTASKLYGLANFLEQGIYGRVG